MILNFRWQMSRRLKYLIASRGGFIERLMRILGLKILKAWNKEAASSRRWRSGNIYVPFKGSGRFKVHTRLMAPLPDRLTVRTGRLRRAARGGVGGSGLDASGAGGFGLVSVHKDGFVVTKGTRGVPYAARQEYQKAGARSYIRRGLSYVLRNSLKTIWRGSVKEAMKE